MQLAGGESNQRTAAASCVILHKLGISRRFRFVQQQADLTFDKKVTKKIKCVSRSTRRDRRQTRTLNEVWVVFHSLGYFFLKSKKGT